MFPRMGFINGTSQTSLSVSDVHLLHGRSPSPAAHSMPDHPSHALAQHHNVRPANPVLGLQAASVAAYALGFSFKAMMKPNTPKTTLMMPHCKGRK